ncbi:MAG TPA: F0F1 ATP synthase subunit A [Pyrinomonadaceae bacterium]
MFWLLSVASEGAGKVAEQGEKAQHAATPEHHVPVVVQFLNHYLGEPVYRFEMSYTRPLWAKFFNLFHTTPEAVFQSEYSPETAIPWYTVMFVIAAIVSVALIWILRGQLSTDEPGHGQQTLELSVLAIRDMLSDIVGPHGLKYFPVVATFAVLILVSNLLGFFPLFMSPTASVNVTFALGLTSFFYYNYIGVKENGLFGHLKHFAGPIWWISPLIFLIEIIGNMVRPLSLGLRLFGNMFADEQVGANIANIYPPVTYFVLPLLMPLGLFVAIIQTFVFTLLSMVYISEVSHAPHGEHGMGHDQEEYGNIAVPA